MFKVTGSAGKHGVSDEEIVYAVLHYAGKEEIRDRNGLDAVVFVGPRHLGALEEDYIEVVVKNAGRGEFVAFHAMTVTDHWRYLIG
ncbi:MULTISPECIES: hypothetical protein [Bifidobacterium]|uniref:hypothetical protein n=1 Tax=Bifidobacterium TaxID=1678 RepID=UPI0018DD438A|nr:MULTISPECIES: hypothetical protein [Bifidobacterium]MBH9981106.1 hypothetical protein [Bifidobacterium asteroides]MBI0100372.1 hypothetical protein [Bifidobacterium sp. W8114]